MAILMIITQAEKEKLELLFNKHDCRNYDKVSSYNQRIVY